ncbi:MAG: hypothetical protein O9264_17640 [Leptospira sp.]|jgi:hypothetical protein|nr:hypothetical protein [Leptospira sp.]
MKKSLSLLIATFTLLALVACSSGSKVEAPKPVPVAGKGVVSVLPNGAGFAIEADGKKYVVVNADVLGKKLQKDKSKVEFAGDAVSSNGVDSITLTSAK